MKRLLLSVIFCVITAFGAYSQKPSLPHAYYLSPQGSDTNLGTSAASPWQTITKLYSLTLHPGDKVLLEGGQTFTGTIELDSIDSGTPGNPIVISSFGKGQAIINAGNANGFTGNNCRYITLKNLVFTGSGVETNNGTGILFNSTRTNKQCRGIVIYGCRAQGFHNFGILINCAEGETIKGFDSVTISHCTATENGEAGIASLGGQTAFHHTNITVSYCNAFLNRGIRTKTDGHSGNGIVMSSVRHLLITHCLAYENGALNNSMAGGPVGIWMWVCRDAVIEHCESHHNHAGLDKDGGGFDIDGGCSNCTMQYNYSHDNEGAGYLLAEYGSGMRFANNTVRFNISQNDGRKNGYGGIGFWGVSAAFEVTNTFVYNNTVYVNDSNLVSGMPAAVLTMGNYFSHVLVANNVFVTSGAARMLNSDTQLDTSAIYFAGNNYYSTANKYNFNYNNVLMDGVAAWLGADACQETYNGRPTSTWAFTAYRAAGASTGEKNTVPLAPLQAYHLLPGKKPSAGMDLKAIFNINIGRVDFYGTGLGKYNYNFAGAVIK